MDATLKQAFRDAAKDLDKIDRDVYAAFEQDPLEPIFGEGDPHARIAFFGRDPGREEVRRQIPFIGAGGQKIRAVLHQQLMGAPLPGFEASVAVGNYVFWVNTLPYKPIGNKAWSMAAKKRFQPLILELLQRHWRGRDVITLGREAFLWFGIHRDKETRTRLEAFWKREDRFEASLSLPLLFADGTERSLQIHPLPHPSPLNAVWFKRFDGLLAQRLTQLKVDRDRWRLPSADGREA